MNWLLLLWLVNLSLLSVIVGMLLVMRKIKKSTGLNNTDFMYFYIALTAGELNDNEKSFLKLMGDIYKINQELKKYEK